MNSTIQHTTTTTTWFELYEDLHQYDRVFVQHRDQFYELVHLSVDIESNVMHTETTALDGEIIMHPKSGLVTWYALAAAPEVMTDEEYFEGCVIEDVYSGPDPDDEHLAHFGTIAESKAREAAAHEAEVMTDDEAGAILTEIAYSLLDAMETEPAPDEYATRPMPPVPDEPEYEDVPDSADLGDEYDEDDEYLYGYDGYEDDEDDLSPFGEDYDEPDAEPVPTDLPPSLLPPSAVTPVTVDYFEAQDKLLAADATGWEPRHLKHLPLLIQVTDVNLTADLLIAALTAQVEEIPF